ncbi:MAG: hypothetical protein WA989_15075 [Henriciella sp.]|uniref:hypothetical protein n=1 Tax=Henriciella sp. TaxID=1968823 RepID=UPI003C72E7D8
MVPAAAKSIYDGIYERIVHEARLLYHDVVHWLGQRSDGEQIVIGCVFILLLLWLIVRMSMRKENDAGAGRNFGGSVLLVMIFAFGIGWMIDSGSGSLSFVFGT